MNNIKVNIKGTDTPESQKLLQELDPKKDLLLTVGEVPECLQSGIKVEYIKPINDLRQVGLIDSEDLQSIVEEFGEDIALEIESYEVTYKEGVYGIVANLSVTVYERVEESGKLRMPVLLCLIATIFTGLATIVYIVGRLCRKRKWNIYT